VKATHQLRQLLREPGIIVMPMAYDCFSAKLIERAGFEAVGITGHGVSASVLGASDVGLITETEMVRQARNIAGAVSLPVVADADTGYGNPINMMRTVRDFERAGVAAVYFEDQVAPKKCGHFAGKGIISRDDMVMKIKAAVDARDDPEFVLIARSDAVAVAGIDEAIARVNIYRDAGVDVVFIDAPESADQVRRIGAEVRGPVMLNIAEGGKTPLFSVQEAEEMGFKIISFSNTLLRVAGKAMQEVLEELKAKGTSQRFLERMISFPERNEILGLFQIYELEKKYGIRPE
jgi:2-methylisocitrate lyase-like PEP mutase family enzyme